METSARSAAPASRTGVTELIRPHSAPGRAGTTTAGPRAGGAGFWIVAHVFAVTMAFTTVPAPLYVLYQARDHFGAAMVTVIFAAYAAGVVASLLLAGHASDWLGRRRIVAAAVGINMAAGIVFLAWPTVTGLLAGRLVSGISAGLITATATAFLAELHSSSRPGAPSARAELVSTAANLGGLGLGALLAGFLAEYTAAPLWLPYLVAEGLMLAGAIALAAAPETVVRPDRRRPDRRGRRGQPQARRFAGVTKGSGTLPAPAARPLKYAKAMPGACYATPIVNTAMAVPSRPPATESRACGVVGAAAVIPRLGAYHHGG